MNEKLSEKEVKFLKIIMKWEKNLYVNYIFAGICFCLAFFGLIVGIYFKNNNYFLMAIYFTTVGGFLVINASNYSKIISIIKKLR